MRTKSRCPVCHKNIEFSANAAGRKVRCPYCKEIFRAADAEPEILEAEPAEPELASAVTTAADRPEPKPISAKRQKPAMALLLRVVHDPRDRLRGVIEAEISEDGLTLRDVPNAHGHDDSPELPI